MTVMENILKRVINYYSKREIVDINTDIYEEKVDPELVWNFIKEDILKCSGTVTMNKLNKRTTNIDNFDMDFIGVYSNKDNTNIKVILPKLTNLKSALIYVREMTHYVFLESRKGIKTDKIWVDEIIPFLSEFYFLRKYYPEEYFDNHVKKLRNNVIKYSKELKNNENDNKFEKISYIFSYYILKTYEFLKEYEHEIEKVNQSKVYILDGLLKHIQLFNYSIYDPFYKD